MENVALGKLVKIKTGKLDVNASEENGKYPFFTCAREISRINEFAFDCEAVLVAGNGELNVKYYEGKFNAYQRTYVIESLDKSVLSVKYLYYYLDGYIEKLRNGAIGGVIKYIKLGHLTDIDFPLPDIETQNKIVAILDKAKSILDKREITVLKFTALIQATFIELFGDPVKNDLEWPMVSLSDYGSLKNGINYSSNDSGIEVACLGVGDFKSLWKISNTASLSKISLSKMPTDDYFLQNRDLVFVRSNGNKELVGRCVVVYPNNEKVTYSGFCIRYRLMDESFNATYLTHLFRIPVFRKSMLLKGRGANIQNINQKLLEDLKIPIPPIELQNEFESKVEAIDKLVSKIQKSQSIAQSLLNSISQQAFNKRLTIDVDTELEALVNTIDIDKKDDENSIKTLLNDVTYLQRLIDRLQAQEFADDEQYEKAKYILFRIMKEEPNLVKQEYDSETKKIILSLK